MSITIEADSPESVIPGIENDVESLVLVSRDESPATTTSKVASRDSKKHEAPTLKRKFGSRDSILSRPMALLSLNQKRKKVDRRRLAAGKMKQVQNHESQPAFYVYGDGNSKRLRPLDVDIQGTPFSTMLGQPPFSTKVDHVNRMSVDEFLGLDGAESSEMARARHCRRMQEDMPTAEHIDFLTAPLSEPEIGTMTPEHHRSDASTRTQSFLKGVRESLKTRSRYAAWRKSAASSEAAIEEDLTLITMSEFYQLHRVKGRKIKRSYDEDARRITWANAVTSGEFDLSSREIPPRSVIGERLHYWAPKVSTWPRRLRSMRANRMIYEIPLKGPEKGKLARRRIVQKWLSSTW